MSDRLEGIRDQHRHASISHELITLYITALAQLISEGNEAAKIAKAAISPGIRDAGYQEMGTDIRSWVYNIHHNTWSGESLAGLLKARVVVLRIQDENAAQ